MTASNSALIGAIVGGLASLAGVIATGMVTMRLDITRRTANAHDEFVRTLRAQTAEVFRLIFVLEHQLHTVCWFAYHAPDALSDERIDGYENQVQNVMPQLQSAAAVVAAMDLTVYQRLHVWIERLDILEGDIARLLHSERSSQTLSQLASLLKTLQDFFHSLPIELGSILQLIGEPQETAMRTKLSNH